MLLTEVFCLAGDGMTFRDYQEHSLPYRMVLSIPSFMKPTGFHGHLKFLFHLCDVFPSHSASSELMIFPSFVPVPPALCAIGPAHTAVHTSGVQGVPALRRPWNDAQPDLRESKPLQASLPSFKTLEQTCL